ncbi:SGNH/GDSL hydrolase family protein [uncultured Arthrobacter sp.]|uniref:SGNH/GDSL hydrolase family protein n=1 Tax=uncultured Arthrobacter sp. TaxID=114050 RepID=UPI002634AED7|nr:SGNH/GDSL hydrolase family protein [uncultured Arthrobacter sp.]
MVETAEQEYLDAMKLLRIAASTLLASGLIAGSAVLPASAGDRGTTHYVALGDSYAAGVGAGPLGFCGQSPLGYPELLDERKRIDLVANVTCAGAQSLEVLQDPNVPDVPTQIAQLVPAVLNDKTDLVTLTVGGNDVGYQTVIAACGYGTAVCTQAVNKTVLFAQNILSVRLDALYDEIDARARKAEVVVTGYPHLFSPNYGATFFVPAIDLETGLPLQDQSGAPVPPLPLTPAEQQIINAGTDELNKVIRAEAKKAGFTYVDVVKRFNNHGLGSPQPWIQPFTNAGALHPTAKGYKNGYLHEIRQAIKHLD